MARTFDIAAFVKTHKASATAVKKGTAKVCTRKDCVCGNIPLKKDAFYRDKSQVDGRSPWCKAGERAYNAAYRTSLKKVAVSRVRDIDNDKGRTTFDKTMLANDNARAIVRASRPKVARKSTRRAKA